MCRTFPAFSWRNPASNWFYYSENHRILSWMETYRSSSSLCMCAQLLSPVQFFAIPWTTAGQILSPWNTAGKNTEVGCHFLLHEVFPIQGSNPPLLCLLHWQAISLPLCILGSHPLLHHSPNMKIWVLLDYLKESFPPLTGSLFHICLILVILSHRHVKTSKCREESSLNFPYGPKDKSSERNSIVINPFPKSFIN